ncbi:MAG TPA: type VI secretion system contractile sheath small subunit [Bordetella sp.]|jgi:type VI secretion system protein ImpB|nr:type VI secretion system contractile sheath small subunit [Bordetella sp.]
MTKESSQKSIGRMRPPRVQIEYDVEVNGAEKKVSLPFVMGVMSDLSGQALEALPPVAERKFLEIDSENFDARMSAIKPRVAVAVPNALTGEGNLGVDLTFESMDDFSPAAIANKVEPLRRLLEARSHLSNLLTYMDGKVAAEDMVSKLLSDPALMQVLATAGKASGAQDGSNAGDGEAAAPTAGSGSKDELEDGTASQP